jgi:hypothetical protein
MQAALHINIPNYANAVVTADEVVDSLFFLSSFKPDRSRRFDSDLRHSWWFRNPQSRRVALSGCLPQLRGFLGQGTGSPIWSALMARIFRTPKWRVVL